MTRKIKFKLSPAPPEQLTLDLQLPRGRPRGTTKATRRTKRNRSSVLRFRERDDRGYAKMDNKLGLLPLTPHIDQRRPARNKELRAFYETTPLPELRKAIELTDKPNLRMLYYALADPAFTTSSFADLCRRCKVTIVDLVGAWRSYHISKGMIDMMREAPRVMLDVAIDAQTRVVICPGCDGKGRVAGTRENTIRVCPECHGDGQIRLAGNKESRQLLFEAAGLVGKSEPRMIQQVNITNPELPSLEDSIKSVESSIDIGVSDADPPVEGVEGDSEHPQPDSELS